MAENNEEDKINLSSLDILVVDQDQTIYEGPGDSIIGPGKEGIEIGILPFHTPFYTKLYKGELRIFNKGQTKTIPIEGGIARVINNNVIILVGF